MVETRKTFRILLGEPSDPADLDNARLQYRVLGVAHDRHAVSTAGRLLMANEQPFKAECSVWQDDEETDVIELGRNMDFETAMQEMRYGPVRRAAWPEGVSYASLNENRHELSGTHVRRVTFVNGVPEASIFVPRCLTDADDEDRAAQDWCWALDILPRSIPEPPRR